MPANPVNSSSGASPQPPAPARKSVVLPVVLIGVAVVLLAVVASKKRAGPAPRPTNVVAAPQPGPSPRPAPRPPAPPSEPEPEIVSGLTPPPAPPTGPQTTPSRAAPPPAAVAAPAGPAPSAYTRQLVQNLTGIDPARGLTAEQAEQWKGELQKLIKEGAAAVPAIREFLQKNLDLGFEGLPGGELLGGGSLRQVMFDALAQIGGPEAVGLLTQTIQTTADPREIALLARNLDQVEPGQHAATALAAARQVLALAGQNPATMDTSPLFEVFQKYGGAEVAAELEQAALKWNYYGPMALAALPEGAGVASLTRMAQDPDGQFRSSSRFALQMLAQLAPDYPEAAKALAEQAQAGKVPDTAWYGIASALAGTQVFPCTSYLDVRPVPPAVSDPKSYSIPSNRQCWRSFNVAANWTPEQRAQQLRLLDQLIAASPAAAAQLKPVRDAFAPQ